MGKSDNGIGQEPGALSRPNLFGNGSTAPATEHNILDAMSGGPVHAPVHRPFRLLWLLLPLLVAGLWVVSTPFQKAPASGTVVPTVAGTAPVPVAQVAQVVVPVATVPEPAAPTNTANPSGAVSTASNPFNTLETAPASPLPSGTLTVARAPAAVDLQSLPDAVAPRAAPKPKDPPPRVASTSKSATGMKTADSATAKSTDTQPAAPKTKTAKAPATTETKTAPSQKSRGQDPDVELLSALMKHLDDDKGAAPAANRSAQTIAELVRSCKGNDGIEVLLCQRRICEGSWGKAEACPMNLAPKSAAKVAATKPDN